MRLQAGVTPPVSRFACNDAVRVAWEHGGLADVVEGEEEHDASYQHGGPSFFGVVGLDGVPSQHKQRDADHYDAHIQVLLQGIFFTKKGAHDHDRYWLTRFC